MTTMHDLMQASCQCIHFVDLSYFPAIKEEIIRYDISIFEIYADNIQTENQLLKDISEAMLFPDYFGNNWDALEECLRDMEWIPAKGYVLLVHNADQLWKNQPRLAGSLIETWLFCVERWKGDSTPFHLVFGMA